MNENIETPIPKISRAFRKGLAELRVKDVQPATSDICAVLGVNTKQGFAYYADGKAKNLDIDKARRIEQIFAAYGVTAPWGN